jgi:3-deoxy-D-manno-octulosonic-acid transferase
MVLASARLSARSVARYRRFGGLFRGIFSGSPLVAAQTDEDAARFAAIGAAPGRTHVIGNVKFDVAPEPAAVARGRELKAAFGARPVWIAGSTHDGEEDAALSAHATLRSVHAEALLLLVPRHPERFQSVADLLGRRGLRFERRSSSSGLGPEGELPPDCQVLLVDTVGELAALYAAVDVAFVGGSLAPVGGHNLLEPAALGVPILTGPHQSNARDVAGLLLRSGGAIVVHDAGELGRELKRLFGDAQLRQEVGARGLEVVQANRGSVARLLTLVETVIPSAAN